MEKFDGLPADERGGQPGKSLISSKMEKLHILFVDDEQLTLNAINRLLRRELYSLYAMDFVTSGEQALAIMAEKPIHILVSDIKMPEMTGISLLKKVKASYPDTVRLALSAYGYASELLDCINTGEIFRFVTKPIVPEELRQAIWDASEYYLLRKDRVSLVSNLEEKTQSLLAVLEVQKHAEKRQEEIIHQLKEANAKFNSLSGVLPICMHCRKIQDTKGVWSRIEQYFREQTGTEFSHGICPECAKDLFPDLKLYE